MMQPIFPPEFARLLAPKRTRRKKVRKGGPGSADEPLPPLEHHAVLIALDISSTCTGYAVASVRQGVPDVSRCGLIRPRATDRPWERIMQITEECRSIVWTTLQSEAIHRDPPNHVRVVLEWSEGHIHRGHSGHGLAVTGQAQGTVWENLRHIAPVDLVGDDVWTRNLDTNTRPKKEHRSLWAYANVRVYREHAGAPSVRDGTITFPNDPGYDVGDAVALACWRCAIAAGQKGILWK